MAVMHAQLESEERKSAFETSRDFILPQTQGAMCRHPNPLLGRHRRFYVLHLFHKSCPTSNLQKRRSKR
eukprot:evm.model.scf_2525.2 EVM.evm.TU.scf_2525.2   scf_2525:9209-9412(+)